MQKIPAYCTVDFLEQFALQGSQIFAKAAESDTEERIAENYLLLKKIIKSRCILFMNSRLPVNVDNPFVKALIKGSSTGGSSIEYSFSDESLAKLPSLLRLVHKKDEVLDLVETSSIRILLENEHNLRCLTEIIHCKVDSRFAGWHNLKFNLPTTGLIIADPYISSDWSDKNVETIINGLLGDHTKFHQVDISIFTKENDRNFIPKKAGEKFAKLASSLKIGATVNLTVHVVRDPKFHDRHIISNYFHGFSGHSLSYYGSKDQVDKDTTFVLTSLGSIDNNPHFNYIDYFRKIARSGKAGFDMFGNGKNVLFDFDQWK